MKYLNRLDLIAGKIVMILVLAAFIVFPQILSAQNDSVSYIDIITALNTKVPNPAFNTKSEVIRFIINDIEKRKVGSPLTPDIEKLLRNAGATDKLIQTINENSPKPTTVSDDSKKTEEKKAEEKKVEEKNAAFYFNRGISYKQKADSFLSSKDNSKAVEQADLALKDFAKVIELDPKYADAYRSMGMIYYDIKGQTASAEKNLIEAAKLKTYDDSEVYYTLGRIFESKNQYDATIENLTKAIKLKADSDAYYYRAKAYKAKGEFQPAVEDCSKIIELKPNEANGYICRGELYNLTNKYELAVQDLTKGLNLIDKNPDKKMAAPYYYARGLAYENNKDIQNAIADYKKTLELDTNNEKAKTNLDKLIELTAKNDKSSSKSDSNTAKSNSNAGSEKSDSKIVSENVLNSKASKLPAPAYPSSARMLRASGTVKVQVEINENGDVVSAKAVSGHPLLNGVAEDAARKAKFASTYVDGKPTKVSGIIVYLFKL